MAAQVSAHRVGLQPLADLPTPQPCQPVLNLSATTWGVGGPETRRSRTASATFVPVLGYPDPNPFECFRLFGRWRR